jgi:hypothetical protein
VLPLCWIVVGHAYARTMLYLQQQSKNTQRPVSAAYRRLQLRLLLFAAIFFCTWLLNSVWYFLLSIRVAHLSLGIIGTTYYAVGLLDATAYGYGTGASQSIKERLSELMSTHVGGPGGAPRPRSEVASLHREISMQLGQRRIFTTSLNCGHCTRPRDLGRVDEWIPQYGYDLYVVAFQECRSVSQSVRQSVTSSTTPAIHGSTS